MGCRRNRCCVTSDRAWCRDTLDARLAALRGNTFAWAGLDVMNDLLADDLDKLMFTVRIDASLGFRAEAPRLLFEGPYLASNRYGHFYDVTPDGRRFLMVRVEPPPPATEIRIVFNWFE